LARILVIDDEALIRETIKAMLQMENHEIVLARHGDESLRHFFCAQAFDLVICDLFAARRDGTETVSAIRRIAPEIPIIAMAGGAADAPTSGSRDSAPALEHARLIGVTATIGKPFRSRELSALVRRCLGKAAPSAS
jgi:CheY-like chemotaxis protein